MTEKKFIQITRHGDVSVAHLAAAINERDQILSFADELLQFIADEKPIKLQINFEHVKFFSSEGFNTLIRAQRRVREHNGQMNLCGLSRDLRKLFKVCNLDGTVFQIFDSCRDASEALESGTAGT